MRAMSLRWLFPLAAGLMLLSTAALAQEQVYTRGPTALFNEPDDQGDVIAQLPMNVPLVLYGCDEDRGWCQVAWGGVTGFVVGDALMRVEGSTTVYLDDTANWSVPIIVWGGDGYRHDHWRGRPGGWHDPRGDGHDQPGHGKPGQPWHGQPWHGNPGQNHGPAPGQPGYTGRPGNAATFHSPSPGGPPGGGRADGGHDDAGHRAGGAPPRGGGHDGDHDNGH